MSQSPPNYMDGVPVKISERFKPPPKITLPQSVINRLAQVQSGGTLRTPVSYDFDLEATVLKRITEWRAAKEKERYEREERVRLKELERTRLAEEEQKQRSPADSNENEAKKKLENQCSPNQNQDNDVSVVQNATPLQSLSYQPQSQYQPTAYTQSSGQEVLSNDYYKSYDGYHYNYGAAYAPPSSTPSNASYATQDSRFLSQYQSTAGTSYQQSTQSQYQPFNYFPYTSSSSNSATQSTYANAYFYNSTYGHQSQLAPNYNNYPVQANATATETPSAGYNSSGESSKGEDASSLRSKSKSVPDIVRQLDEEVKNSAQRRTRNNSQSVAESNPAEEKSIGKSESSTQDYTLYNRLSPTDQNLVKRIGSMGFPLERVAAVLTRIGNNDKKIVEHLIPLSELLDLGFEEEKISEALVKFDNNKHKALDYLIS